ncbi:MAG: hypothetical protein H6509_15520 [Bryobacterales bacterium]|nr:hypothetical protein [Acidobacteriota bacterium]MCB9386019.1 hypothetical protein [Bryobacterales bacterium]
MIDRRTFFSLAAAGLASSADSFAQGAPKRIAVVTTIYRYLSHAQHMADRFLVGYPYDGVWHQPKMEIVSLYVDQHPEGDQSQERAKEFGFKVYPSIAEALRCGGDKLACDAVLLIGEHGDYPSNDLGQKLYPRYEFFKQIVKVFEEDGRVVPVYNDKHLSYSFDKAKEMVADSQRLKFPMLAGSSLPVTWRLPNLELPLGCEIEDALMVGVGGSDPMDYHALEAMQCMVERRKGGESGVKRVEMIEGDAVWKAGEAGRWSKELLTSAISRSDTPMGVGDTASRPHDMVGSGEIYKLVEKPAAYFIERNDGLHTTLLMLNGAVKDYTFACKVKGMRSPQSLQFFLTPTPNVTYSACLIHGIEEMFATGKAPYPVERTLIVSGALEACLKSRKAGKPLETPYLDVKYKAPKGPHHCRA